jgi:cytoskeletal protein RodZ
VSTPARRRQSPAVYRRRRLVLLVGLVLIVALVWLFIAQPWRGNAAPSPAPATPASAPASTPSSTPAATGDVNDGANSDAVDPTTESADGVPTCTDADVTVEALTDAASYAPDQNPQLSIRLTNTSDADCTLNVGTTGQSFTITSGNDTWWRSTDCQSEPSDTVATIEAGQTVTSAAPIAWDRTRSSVDTCQDANRVKAPGGGASYHLAVAIGGIPATSTAQFVLN